LFLGPRNRLLDLPFLYPDSSLDCFFFMHVYRCSCTILPRRIAKSSRDSQSWKAIFSYYHLTRWVEHDDSSWSQVALVDNFEAREEAISNYMQQSRASMAIWSSTSSAVPSVMPELVSWSSWPNGNRHHGRLLTTTAAASPCLAGEGGGDVMILGSTLTVNLLLGYSVSLNISCRNILWKACKTVWPIWFL
jgi:hypothetical protein